MNPPTEKKNITDAMKPPRQVMPHMPGDASSGMVCGHCGERGHAWQYCRAAPAGEELAAHKMVLAGILSAYGRLMYDRGTLGQPLERIPAYDWVMELFASRESTIAALTKERDEAWALVNFFKSEGERDAEIIDDLRTENESLKQGIASIKDVIENEHLSAELACLKINSRLESLEGDKP